MGAAGAVGRLTPHPAREGLRPPETRTILNHMVQYTAYLDDSFAALADGTRRGILERLGAGEATISDLASGFTMTLTGIKKHVQVLERAGLVTTRKAGRVRLCRLGPRRLDDAAGWIAQYRQQWEDRLDRLDAWLDKTEGGAS